MAFDEGLAERIRECLAERNDVEEKKMFGGLCFMVARHMCCGIVGDVFMGRVHPDIYQDCLKQKYVREMDFTGRAMQGMIYVEPAGVSEDATLKHWVQVCTDFVESLPPKR